MKSKIHLPSVGVFYFGLFAVSIWVHWNWEVIKLPATSSGLSVLTDLGFGALMALPLIGLSYILTQRVKAFQRLAGEIHVLLGTVSHEDAFFLAAFSSIGEEFLFRGVIQGYLGLVITSLVFGLLHSGPNKRFLPWTLFAVFAGFAMGLVYEWRESIVAPVAMHFTVNYVNLVALRKIVPQKEAS